jgi:hypothetical protein
MEAKAKLGYQHKKEKEKLVLEYILVLGIL